MNKRLEKIQISGIRRFAEKVKKVDGAISLTIGQPDFYVPIEVSQGMINAIEKNKTSYTSNAGIDELREEICTYLNGFGIKYNKEEVCITVGGSEGLFSVLFALLNEGDKILIPGPAYENISIMLGAEVINYKLNENFTVNIDEIKHKLDTENVKYLMLSFPSNPTGAILTKNQRDELIDIIKERDITVITLQDLYFNFMEAKHVTIFNYHVFGRRAFYRLGRFV